MSFGEDGEVGLMFFVMENGVDIGNRGVVMVVSVGVVGDGKEVSVFF